MLQMPRLLTIAIDGPAAAGKSTASKRIAKRLNLALVDTGALYRCVALAAQQQGVGWDSTHEQELGDIAGTLNVRFEFDGEVNKVYLNDEDVSSTIRTAEASDGASKIATLPAVRASLLELQRSLANRPPGAVLEGRDIGTVVLPDAALKFFLVASIEKRVQRRYDELKAAGRDPDWDELLKAETERDKRDSERATAPLKQADDAILIDSSSLTADEVITTMLAEVRKSQKALARSMSANLTKELQASADDAAHAPGAAQQGADGKPRDDCAGGSGNILDALQYVFGAAYECGTPRKKQNEQEDCTGRTRKN
jgi:cytidylate kinase